MVFVFDANATPTKGVNSYVTVDEVIGYATAHAYTGDALVTSKVLPFIFRAMTFIESYRDKFQGIKTVATQALQWPRRGVLVDNQPVGMDVIPDEIREAVSVCAIEMVEGYDPNKPIRAEDDAEISSNLSVLGSRVSERYLVNWGLQDVLPRVESLLAPLLRDDVDDIVVRI